MAMGVRMIHDLPSREGMERSGRVRSGTQDGTDPGRRHSRGTNEAVRVLAYKGLVTTF